MTGDGSRIGWEWGDFELYTPAQGKQFTYRAKVARGRGVEEIKVVFAWVREGGCELPLDPPRCVRLVWV